MARGPPALRLFGYRGEKSTRFRITIRKQLAEEPSAAALPSSTLAVRKMNKITTRKKGGRGQGGKFQTQRGVVYTETSPLSVLSLEMLLTRPHPGAICSRKFVPWSFCIIQKHLETLTLRSMCLSRMLVLWQYKENMMHVQSPCDTLLFQVESHSRWRCLNSIPIRTASKFTLLAL